VNGNRNGRGWAYTSLVFGGLVSVVANVAHSYVPPAGAPADWSPEAGAVLSAVFWPVALFFAIEMLARIAWPHSGWWFVLRFGGLLPVALVAAVVSYWHLSGLLAHYHEAGITPVIGPLAVDGLMVMATGALIATRRAAPAVPVETPAPADTDAEPEKARGASRTPKRQPSAADRVAAAVARSPKASDATIAARLGLSEATVKRHRRQPVDSVSTPTLQAA